MQLQQNREEYGVDGRIVLGVNVEEKVLEDLTDQINNVSSGKVEIMKVPHYGTSRTHPKTK